MDLKRGLRVVALAVALSGAIVWASLGANTGWTTTSRTEMRRDPVTEIDYPVIEQRFTPGIDFVGGCLLLAAVIAGAAAFIRGQNGNSRGTASGR
jgi:hypothetical protein